MIKVTIEGGEDEEFRQDADAAEKIAELIRQGKLETIHSEEPTLETIFLELTGKKLAED